MPPLGFDRTAPPAPRFFPGERQPDALVGVGPGDLGLPTPPGPFQPGPPPSSIGGPVQMHPDARGVAARLHALIMALQQGQMPPDEQERGRGVPRRFRAPSPQPWAPMVAASTQVGSPFAAGYAPGGQPFARRRRGF